MAQDEAKFLSFEDGFRELGLTINGSSLEWSDVTYDVLVKPKTGLPCKKVPKSILRGISGSAKPGESLAIMGPSGAGKSSMLNILAGRVSKKCGVSIGHSLKFDGVASTPERYGTRIAYVMQDDQLFATATVRETVMFSAYLRPGPFQACEYAKKRALVDMLLKALGLWDCRNTLIGNPPMITGVSGGEKRRVSIACELVTIPEILFLDEPTSGLDSFAAYQVVTALQSLTRAGCNVLCTIHQPSSEVFNLFDNTVLLVNGATVYHGPVAGMTPYFASNAGGGIVCPAGFNPADFFMFHVQKGTQEALGEMEERWRLHSNSAGSVGGEMVKAAGVAVLVVDKQAVLVFPEKAAATGAGEANGGATVAPEGGEKEEAVVASQESGGAAEAEGEEGKEGSSAPTTKEGAATEVEVEMAPMDSTSVEVAVVQRPVATRGRGADLCTQLGMLIVRDVRNLYRDKSAVIGRMVCV